MNKPQLPEWLIDTLQTRGYTDLSVVCNWAHGLFEGPDGISIEVNVIEIEEGKPAIWILALDQRYIATASISLLKQAVASDNPSRLLLERSAGTDLKTYLACMVSDADGLNALLARLEKLLDY